jgi:SAM-dependent methyltransferase
MLDEGAALQRKFYEETATEFMRKRVNWHDEHYRAASYIARMAPEWGISSFLDVGAGTGRSVEFLHDKGLYVRGVEPVEALIQEGIRARPDLRNLLQCGRGESLPYDDDSFDAACEFGVLHHVRRPQLVIQEMLRVARKAVFISDSNRFAQGRPTARMAKFLLFKAGLWPFVNWLKTAGKGYGYSAEDGVFYSYSVYDSLPLLAKWAGDLQLISTVPHASSSGFQPIFTSTHLLVCALRSAPFLEKHD